MVLANTHRVQGIPIGVLTVSDHVGSLIQNQKDKMNVLEMDVRLSTLGILIDNDPNCVSIDPSCLRVVF